MRVAGLALGLGLWVVACEPVQVVAPAPDASSAEDYERCEASPAYDPEVHGPVHPWTGYTHWDDLQTEFVCNTCPGGAAWLQGTWVRMDPEAGTPDAPCSLDFECFPKGWGRDRAILGVLEVEGNLFTRRVFQVATGDEWWWRGYYFCGTVPDVVLEGAAREGQASASSGIKGWVPTEILRAPYQEGQLQVGQGLLMPAGFVFSADDGTTGYHAMMVEWWFGTSNDSHTRPMYLFPWAGTGYYCRSGADLGLGVTCPESPFTSDEPVLLPWEPADPYWTPPRR